MWPLIALFGAGIAALIAATSSSSNESTDSKVTTESDCNEEFLKFEANLSLPASKKRQLDSSRRALQKKIKEYFTAKSGTSTPLFYIQGSYKHGTLIRKQDDTCDVDVGVYFKTKPSITPLSIQNNIIAAVGNHTTEKATKKNKCVRIYFAGQFHVDLPVYYIEGDNYYFGIGDSGWRICDPKMFTNWLKEETKDNLQKIRIIKYFKAWADLVKIQKGKKMPSGLAFTLWVIQYFTGDKREDIAFVRTAEKLQSALIDSRLTAWACVMPVAPNDNVVEKLDEKQRENFLVALADLVSEGNKILNLSDKSECYEDWKKLLGKWF